MLTLAGNTNRTDYLSVGIMMLGHNGQVLDLNKYASKIIERGHIKIHGDRIVLENEKQNDRLKEIIENIIDRDSVVQKQPIIAALRCCAGKEQGCVEILVLPYVSGQKQLNSISKNIYAWVFINYVDKAIRPASTVLKDLYQLTPTEIEICWEMLEQRNTEEIAERLSITQNSVRFHYKNLFRKMGIRRQSELIQVVAGGVAGLSCQNKGC